MISLNFSQWMKRVPKTAVFTMKDYHVWCPTVVKGQDGLYHMLFSRWPKEYGHDGWVTHSEVAYAVADKPLGPFEYKYVILKGAGTGKWDGDVIHNPTMIEYEGKYYVYYMGNHGNGDYWDHRNRQRIGVAVADHPAGPWKRFADPVIDVSPGSWDHLMTSNPTVTRSRDGRFIMVYKGVSEGPLPKGGAVVCGVATADQPLGPFRKVAGPIMVNPENNWSVEDPYIWSQNGCYFALVKDFQGYFTKTNESSVALFQSHDGLNWKAADHPLAFRREICWEDGVVQHVDAMERPQLLFEQGYPSVLYCAIGVDKKREQSFIVHIPLISR